MLVNNKKFWKVFFGFKKGDKVIIIKDDRPVSFVGVKGFVSSTMVDWRGEMRYRVSQNKEDMPMGLFFAEELDYAN